MWVHQHPIQPSPLFLHCAACTALTGKPGLAAAARKRGGTAGGGSGRRPPTGLRAFGGGSSSESSEEGLSEEEEEEEKSEDDAVRVGCCELRAVLRGAWSAQKNRRSILKFDP